jgi:hypothetical protein
MFLGWFISSKFPDERIDLLSNHTTSFNHKQMKPNYRTLPNMADATTTP